MNKYSVVVVGSGGVGKSAITLTFVRNRFVEEYDPTIEDSYSKNCKIEGEDCHLDITDTAGQEEYRGLWGDKYLRKGDGFLVIFSITSKESFKEVDQFRERISRAKESDKVPMIIVGNKCDLEHMREVKQEEAKAYVDSIGGIYIETSAKNRLNIDEVFQAVVGEIRKGRKSMANVDVKKSKCCIVL